MGLSQLFRIIRRYQKIEKKEKKVGNKRRMEKEEEEEDGGVVEDDRSDKGTPSHPTGRLFVNNSRQTMTLAVACMPPSDLFIRSKKK